MASEHGSLEPALHEMTLTTISSGLVSNPTSLTPYVTGMDIRQRQKTQSKKETNTSPALEEREKVKVNKLLAEERKANINNKSTQFPVVHQPPQETSLEFLQDNRNLINSVQTFLGKFKRFSFYETPKVVSLAWETISEIEHAFEDKQYQPKEEIDIFPGPDDSIPPGIKSDDYDSEVDDNSTSLPEFESFHVDYPDSGDSTIDVVEDIPVDVPNILPTHPTLHMDFDFIPSHNDLGSDLDVSSPSGDRNKIYDPGICIEVGIM
ncbi:hypothetical protein Tco_0716580 [Tanacetum coccineum]